MIIQCKWRSLLAVYDSFPSTQILKSLPRTNNRFKKELYTIICFPKQENETDSIKLRTGRLHKGLGAPTQVSLPVRPELPCKDMAGAIASCTSGRYEPQALEGGSYTHTGIPTALPEAR